MKDNEEERIKKEVLILAEKLTETSAAYNKKVTAPHQKALDNKDKQIEAREKALASLEKTLLKERDDHERAIAKYLSEIRELKESVENTAQIAAKHVGTYKARNKELQLKLALLETKHRHCLPEKQRNHFLTPPATPPLEEPPNIKLAHHAEKHSIRRSTITNTPFNGPTHLTTDEATSYQSEQSPSPQQHPWLTSCTMLMHPPVYPPPARPPQPPMNSPPPSLPTDRIRTKRHRPEQQEMNNWGDVHVFSRPAITKFNPLDKRIDWQETLRQWKLPDLIKAFTKHGYHMKERWPEVTDDDLKKMNIKANHRRVFLNKVKNPQAKQIANDQRRGDNLMAMSGRQRQTKRVRKARSVGNATGAATVSSIKPSTPPPQDRPSPPVEHSEPRKSTSRSNSRKREQRAHRYVTAHISGRSS